MEKKRVEEMSASEIGVALHLKILIRRIFALPSKMVGFKPLCLYLATWLLVRGYIGPWVWLCVLILVLFGIVGLKLVTRIVSGRGPL